MAHPAARLEHALAGRALSSLSLHETLELLELAVLCSSTDASYQETVARLHHAACQASIPAQPPAPALPPPQAPLPSTSTSTTAAAFTAAGSSFSRPPPFVDGAIVGEGVAALRKALLAQRALDASARSALASSPQALEAEKAALDDEILRLVQELKQGGLSTHDTLASGNASLGETSALAEKNLEAVSAAAGELTAADRRFLGYTCSLVGVILQGVVAFLLAYLVMRVFPRPPPLPAPKAAGAAMEASPLPSPPPASSANSPPALELQVPRPTEQRDVWGGDFYTSELLPSASPWGHWCGTPPRLCDAEEAEQEREREAVEQEERQGEAKAAVAREREAGQPVQQQQQHEKEPSEPLDGSLQSVQPAQDSDTKPRLEQQHDGNTEL
jgi:hypothetical protein